jgi:hypothetical protein
MMTVGVCTFGTLLAMHQASAAGVVAPSQGSKDFIGPTQNAKCEAGKLCNPLIYDNIQELLPALLDIVAQIGLVICTFFIIYAGFQYVTAGGDTGKIQKAHGVLLWSVVGTAVLLGAKVLASILSNTVTQIIK